MLPQFYVFNNFSTLTLTLVNASSIIIIMCVCVCVCTKLQNCVYEFERIFILNYYVPLLARRNGLNM